MKVGGLFAGIGGIELGFKTLLFYPFQIIKSRS